MTLTLSDHYFEAFLLFSLAIQLYLFNSSWTYVTSSKPGCEIFREPAVVVMLGFLAIQYPLCCFGDSGLFLIWEIISLPLCAVLMGQSIETLCPSFS